MTPLEAYRASLASDSFQPDPAQETAVHHLQQVYDALLAPHGPAKTEPESLIARLRGLVEKEDRTCVRGLYIWGGVGRGKTWLMDAFHTALPLEEKRREHFHSFMQYVHAQLKTLRGTVDPLQTVASRLAEGAKVLCLDEFHISDIADAMLLGRLLGALFERGITLVTTSNIAPDELYKDGLQRQRFLPAIELIKTHTTVLRLEGDTDYRLRALERAEIYHHPLDAEAGHSLMACFSGLAPEHVKENHRLEILGREVQTVRCAEGLVWFEFEVVCNSPRAAPDYIEIARCFHTVLIANVPCMGPGGSDKVLRFIQLVDEFYDRNVNLILSAAGPPSKLYRKGRQIAAFERTRSRLEEMQSREYLARTHFP